MAETGSIIGRLSLLGATVETTKGTAATVTAPMAGTIVYDAKMIPGDLFADGKRRPNLITGGSIESVNGPQFGTLTFRTEWIHGDKTAMLFSACGWYDNSGVLTPSEDIDDHETITFVLWNPKSKRTLRGAAGKFTIEAAGTAQRLMISWEFTGIFDAEVDASPPSFSPVLSKGYRWKDVTFTLATAEIPPIDGITINSNTEVQMREDPREASGILHYYCVHATPTISIAPEYKAVANYDQTGLYVAGTAQALAIEIEDAAGNTLAIAAPKAQRSAFDDGDRGAKRLQTIDLECHASTGEDWLTFTLTDVSP